jgi:hypothetical protein
MYQTLNGSKVLTQSIFRHVSVMATTITRVSSNTAVEVVRIVHSQKFRHVLCHVKLGGYTVRSIAGDL